MKRFYVILFALPILAFTLLYFTVWGFIAGIAAIMLFIAYRYFAERLGSAETRNDMLENEVDELNMRLENAVIKEQKATKETEQIRLLKQQLLTVISHEIRTPMNGVLGTSLLLGETSLNPEQLDYVQTIRSCGESLLSTVNNLLANDILDFSKLQQEGNQLEYKEFDLRDAVEEVIVLFGEKTAKSGVDLVYDIDGDVPSQIIGDNKRLRQVLMNLVENAVKFTSKGEIFVGVHYTPSFTTGYPPELQFEVRDTGTGIPKDQLKQLFKGIPTKENAKDGSWEIGGLGLVICRKLVELMGGRIEVKTDGETGSTFVFNIPLTPSLRATRNQVQHASMNQLEEKNVLIVEDNPTLRAVLFRLAKEWKMSPVIADGGKQALALMAKSTKFDLVITDKNMSGMSGIQLAEAINTQYPGTPVMLMNPVGDEEYKTVANLFASVISKPVRHFILRDHVIRLFTGNATAVAKKEINRLSAEFAGQYPLRILIAEDNPVNQKIATKILNKLGYDPIIAENGKEALEMVSHEQFDMILMDVQMPEMDGLEATRMIRTCLDVQPIIIAMTANVMQGDRDDCMQAGMDDYISKPINIEELLGQFEKWSGVLKEKRA
jgi:signal transduction histidine kinase/CheY-like chemotaxis protein